MHNDDKPTLQEGQLESPQQTTVVEIPQIEPSGAEKIEFYLRSRFEFRYNVAGKRTEFRPKDDIEMALFKDMTDADYNSILRDMSLKKIHCSKDWLRTLLASDFCVMYDPFLDYLNGLPNWDGETDYIGQLAATVQTTNEGFWGICFRKWFVAMVASWLDKEVVNHTAIVFSGKQGIGKTSWFRRLIPQSLKRYIYAGSVNLKDKDSRIKLSECAIIVMDELENLNVNQLDTLKELMTKTSIFERRAYAFTHESYVRRASFTGSINGREFLPDVTGNRRFLCFEAEKIDYQHRFQLTAQ